MQNTGFELFASARKASIQASGIDSSSPCSGVCWLLSRWLEESFFTNFEFMTM
jgi:hypothetical protein